MLRRSGIIAAVGVAIVLSASTGARAALTDVVAVVNGEKITAQELNATLQNWAVPAVLNDMIIHKLVAQEARKAGVVVKPSQVNAAIEEMKKRLPEGETLDHALFVSGMTRSRVTANITTSLRAEAVVRKSIKLEDQELAKYYKTSRLMIRVQAPAAAEPGNQAAVQTEDSDTKAKQKIEKIAEEIKQGLPFEEAAKKYSEDSSSKESGGDPVWLTLDGMRTEIAEAIRAMQVGQVSAPIKMGQSYYLVKVDAAGPSLNAAQKKELTETVVERMMAQGRLVGQWLTEIRSKANIQNALEPKVPKAATAPKPGAQPTNRSGASQGGKPAGAGKP